MYKKNHSTIPETEKNQWFETWFNTPFYHLLYHNRDYEEAEAFISALIKYLKPQDGNKVLDLACGAGRHALTLNKHHLDVLGIDIATQSIEEAKMYENETLHFEVHDMRKVIKANYFDYIFNLFTSFGYFDSTSGDEEVLASCFEQLRQGGTLVLDYFNISKVLEHVPYAGVETRGDIQFQIHKKHIENHIVKSIHFTHEGKTYDFEEKVASYSADTLKGMLECAGFKVVAMFGNYQLAPFTLHSDRAILIATKP